MKRLFIVFLLFICTSAQAQIFNSGAVDNTARTSITTETASRVAADAAHVASTGTAVHGLGTMALETATNYAGKSGANVASTAFAVALGCPQALTKIITGTTGANEGDTVSVAHELDATHIIGISAFLNAGGTNTFVPPNDAVNAGFVWTCNYNATNVNASLHATSSEQVVNSSFTVMLFYLP